MRDIAGTVACIDGNTFMVSDSSGDVESSPATPVGLFAADTRFLSRWMLFVNGECMTALSVDDSQYYEVTFFVVPGAAVDYVQADLSAIRRRRIGPDLTESLTIFNYGDRDTTSTYGWRWPPTSPTSSRSSSTSATRPARTTPTWARTSCAWATGAAPTNVRWSCRRASPPSSTRTASASAVRLRPGEQWSTQLQADMRALRPDGVDLRSALRAQRPDDSTLPTSLRAWVEGAPTLDTDSVALQQVYHRSLVDLAALRFARSRSAAPRARGRVALVHDPVRPRQPADLPADPPGHPRADPTDAADPRRRCRASAPTTFGGGPGRILHELRYGESAAFEEQPHSPYYGTVDASPLFVVLLDEYERWSGDTALVTELEQEARAALAWIDQYADLTSTGYIWYQRRNRATGLDNQCWKDSWDSISYADGRLPGFPRATCETQGYAYDAKIRGARLARTVWDDPELRRPAGERGGGAVRPLQPGLLVGGPRLLRPRARPRRHSGRQPVVQHRAPVVERDRADRSGPPRVVEHLMGPGSSPVGGCAPSPRGSAATTRSATTTARSGRSTTRSSPGVCAATGSRNEAGRIAESILSAATYFEGRLPEAFGGFDRDTTRFPVRYPTAGSPQAWSSGARMLLIRTMLGLDPHEDHLAVDPALPAAFGRIALLDIPGRWGKATPSPVNAPTSPDGTSQGRRRPQALRKVRR